MSSVTSACLRLYSGAYSASGFAVSTSEFLCEKQISDRGLLAAIVLTAAHFIRRASGESPIILGRTYRSSALATVEVPGSDIAVVVPAREVGLPLLTLMRGPAKPLAATVTLGFGGLSRKPREPKTIPGRVALPLPYAMSWDANARTKHAVVTVTTGAIVPQAGDSGGPVLVNGEANAVQSMIVLPMAKFFRLAVASEIWPHRASISWALNAL
ncbi:hypothetical protein QVA66_00335 [Staphylococcus chromogenes]|nr:hypothetical protein [Staphylococcus chromogenes]